MNIMLTSVGRRAYMVKYFKEVLGESGEVHVCNSDDLTVAFNYADKAVISPMIYDEGYIPFLIDYCKKNNINVVLSLFDIDLLVLAKAKEQFEEIGTKLIVSDESFVSVCNDKWMTYQFLTQHSFGAPRTYIHFEDAADALSRGEISYPVVVKARFGMGSIAVAMAHDEEELRFYSKRIARDIESSYLKFESNAVASDERVIYQECIKGQEYGADVINDLNGKTRGIVVRKKLAMRSGETDIAEIVDDSRIKSELIRLGEISKHIGNMDVDVFLKDDQVYILEMNARFGGGYPFSHISGCNLPKAIVAWAEGKDVEDDILRATPGVRAYKELEMSRKYE